MKEAPKSRVTKGGEYYVVYYGTELNRFVSKVSHYIGVPNALFLKGDWNRQKNKRKYKEYENIRYYLQRDSNFKPVETEKDLVLRNMNNLILEKEQELNVLKSFKEELVTCFFKKKKD